MSGYRRHVPPMRQASLFREVILGDNFFDALDPHDLNQGLPGARIVTFRMKDRLRFGYQMKTEMAFALNSRPFVVRIPTAFLFSMRTFSTSMVSMISPSFAIKDLSIADGKRWLPPRIQEEVSIR